ncbi:MAG: gfo/Idh/MocA family oxidoreductase, partial [Rhodospirillales bacterium]|nr:gfo/Idh/MocA family oxidoreductase [Rhodospirillales bacterium]
LSGSKSYGDETMVVSWAADQEQGNPKNERRNYTNDPSWANEIAEFTDAILNDRPVANGSAEDALKTMELVYKIYCADEVWREKWKLTD